MTPREGYKNDAAFALIYNPIEGEAYISDRHVGKGLCLLQPVMFYRGGTRKLRFKDFVIAKQISSVSEKVQMEWAALPASLMRGKVKAAASLPDGRIEYKVTFNPPDKELLQVFAFKSPNVHVEVGAHVLFSAITGASRGGVIAMQLRLDSTLLQTAYTEPVMTGRALVDTAIQDGNVFLGFGHQMVNHAAVTPFVIQRFGATKRAPMSLDNMIECYLSSLGQALVLVAVLLKGQEEGSRAEHLLLGMFRWMMGDYDEILAGDIRLVVQCSFATLSTGLPWLTPT